MFVSLMNLKYIRYTSFMLVQIWHFFTRRDTYAFNSYIAVQFAPSRQRTSRVAVIRVLERGERSQDTDATATCRSVPVMLCAARSPRQSANYQTNQRLLQLRRLQLSSVTPIIIVATSTGIHFNNSCLLKQFYFSDFNRLEFLFKFVLSLFFSQVFCI